jgi:hypothetical protein
MKHLFLLLLACLFSASLSAQNAPKIENLLVVTLDGMRWQEVFGGMDPVLARHKDFNQGDSAEIYQKYWAPDPETRRAKLFPFLWNELVKKGQIYGNRKYGCKVDNANPYWFSYPGYSEIFCGLADTAVNSNDYPPNPHTNVLEFIHNRPEFKGKVAAFGAWDAFDRILNEKRAGFPVVCGYDSCGGKNPTPREQMINAMRKDAYSPFGLSEPLDVFTHYAALEYLKNHMPRVLYISYGETDEWAHHGHYKDYLDSAHQSDAWIQELWNWIQSNPKYRNKTALFIAVDHGRGDVQKEQWTSHGTRVADSHEIWFAVMAPGIPASGEIKTSGQYYQKQYAQTFAELLGLKFVCEHSVADGLLGTLKR